MRKLGAASVHILGVGALGSNLALNLARTGISQLTFIDRDRVEEHNVGTQIYSLEDVGARKAEIVRNILSRELYIDTQAIAQELTATNVGRYLKTARLVVDTFDNSSARELVTKHCLSQNIPCLHAGINDQYAEVIWNDQYRVPSEEGVDACDYPLARNLILMVVAVASESLVRFIAYGHQQNYSITLADMSINHELDR